MADIFEIVGRFAIEGAGKAKKDIEDVTNTGEKSSSALGKFGKVMGTVGKSVLAVGGAVGAGSVALVKSVQSSYGELQQNLGGSEAVYGQYASNIQEIAKDAYKNMGMSQSEYLATANKMGSLFQGSGIAQKEALDMTTKAMQRASDVASVMGIDMSMAMESIAGAAKGNFTMMDNLGVAMNATTLESYALSKGMTDFSWKSASSAEKNALAMQMFLERTEQYAGNFARESTDTISGSIGYLSASWQDFMAGLGNPTADMARLTNNLAQSFGAMINNIVPIIENIANALPIVLPSIVNAISDLAPTLIQTFTDVITKMIDAIIPLLPTVIPLFVDMLVKIGMALAQNAPLLIDGFVQLITQLTVAITQNLPALIPIFIDCMVQIAGAIVQNAPIILDAILGIGANFESGLSPAISDCIDLVEVLTGAFIAFKAGAMIQSVVQGFQSAQVTLALFKMETQGASIAQGLLNGQLTIGQTVVGLLTGQVTLAEIATGLWAKAQGVLNAVMSANPIALVVMAIGALIAIIVVAYQKSETFRNAVNALGNGIKTAFMEIINWFKKLPETISNFIDNAINYIKELPSKIGYWLGFAVGKAVQFAKDFPAKAKEAGTKFVNNLINFIKELPGKISNWISNTISKAEQFAKDFPAKAKTAGINFVNNLINTLKSLPSKVVSIGKDVVKGIWNGITGSFNWIKGKIKEWCGSFIDGFKDALGIHSPSRLMRDEVGKPLVDGVAVGIKENSGEVSKEFQKMLDDLQLQRDLELISESDYYSELEKLRDNHLKKGTKDWWQYTKEIISYEETAFNDLNSAYEDHLKDREDLTSNFYNKLSSNSLYNKITFSVGDSKETFTRLNNWDDELKSLDEFENKFNVVQERLKSIFVGDAESLKSMIDTIRSDPFGEGGNVLDAMFNSTNEELANFANGYQQFIKRSKGITNNVYADELDELDKNFIQQISEKFANSPLLENLKNIGENVTESLMNGIDSKSEWLKEQILKFCSSVNDTFNVGFGTVNLDNSEFGGINDRATLRDYRPDYTEQLNLINDAIDRLIVLIGDYLPDIASKVNRPVMVDGNSLAVGMSRSLDNQLGRISISKERGNV